jgi:hypothetical protein|tara:strand:+ start:8239 stop:8433 length:195 start_codon:yes stop_codon:yes gene_type:complete
MITRIETTPADTIAWKISGTLTDADMRAMLDSVTAAPEGPLNVYVELADGLDLTLTPCGRSSAA